MSNDADNDGGAAGAVPPSRAARLTTAIREQTRTILAVEAQRLCLLAELASEIEAEARLELARGPRVSGQPDDADVVASAVVAEIQVVLGVSAWEAARQHEVAHRLVTVLPDTLTALADGRIDLKRAQVLVDLTHPLSVPATRQVERLVLPTLGDAPWEAPAPRNWRRRVERAVTLVDADAARRRRIQARADRDVRTWPGADGTGYLLAHGPRETIELAAHVLRDLAGGMPAESPDGTRRTLAQRTFDAFADTVGRLARGDAPPTAAGSRERELGLVLHADTLFCDGPAARDPGEQRGLGAPTPIDPVSAREMTRAHISAGNATQVLLVDREGVLQRLVRLPRPPTRSLVDGGRGWTRASLTEAVRGALSAEDLDALARGAPLPSQRCGGYSPTAAIVDHVRAVHATCTSYDCGRAARRCDLDHDEPWPRGPTSTYNLSPRCRRDHEHKTRGLTRTRLHADGAITSRMLTGLVVTTRPEPLPGFGLGEAYDVSRRGRGQQAA
ncbi:MAG: DUF222 domain-containing protein [Actinomycetes bacterium]